MVSSFGYDPLANYLAQIRSAFVAAIKTMPGHFAKRSLRRRVVKQGSFADACYGYLRTKSNLTRGHYHPDIGLLVNRSGPRRLAFDENSRALRSLFVEHLRQHCKDGLRGQGIDAANTPDEPPFVNAAHLV